MNVTALSLAVIIAVVPGAAIAEPERPLVFPQTSTQLQWGPCPPIFSKGCEIAVLHGNPAAPNADIFLRIAPNATLPAHTHSSAERMVLVSGTLLVDYQGTPPSTLQPGNYAYGPAGLPHLATCRSKSPCTLFIAFEGPVDALAHSDSLE